VRKKYYITATAFDKKGRVISTGVNEYNRSHPLFKAMSVLAGESEEKIYKHAEFSACIAAGRKEIYSLLVQRHHNNGEPANAEPCRTCKLVLKYFGVKKVLYTHEEGLKEFIP
jgi:deoxycytidylate deaminase